MQLLLIFARGRTNIHRHTHTLQHQLYDHHHQRTHLCLPCLPVLTWSVCRLLSIRPRNDCCFTFFSRNPFARRNSRKVSLRRRLKPFIYFIILQMFQRNQCGFLSYLGFVWFHFLLSPLHSFDHHMNEYVLHCNLAIRKFSLAKNKNNGKKIRRFIVPSSFHKTKWNCNIFDRVELEWGEVNSCE